MGIFHGIKCEKALILEEKEGLFDTFSLGVITKTLRETSEKYVSFDQKGTRRG